MYVYEKSKHDLRNINLKNKKKILKTMLKIKKLQINKKINYCKY